MPADAPLSGRTGTVVLLDHPLPRVARVCINRPDKRNAIDQAVRQQLGAALSEVAGLAGRGEVRALVLGGAGGVFSAGGDLPSMVGLDEAGARARMREVAALCRRVASLPVPVVSAVEGFGAGAAVGLALLGDQIVVGEGTRLLFPFLRLGLVPDWGQMLTLPRRVGLPAARRLLTREKPVSGAEALHMGLADVLVADADVMPEALRVAHLLAALPSAAFARMKARLTAPSASLDDDLAHEEDDQAFCLLSDDFLEGFAAFDERRPADFVARPGARR